MVLCAVSYAGRNYGNVNVKRKCKQSRRRILDLTSQISAGIWSSDSPYSPISDYREWENGEYGLSDDQIPADIWLLLSTILLLFCLSRLVGPMLLTSRFCNHVEHKTPRTVPLWLQSIVSSMCTYVIDSWTFAPSINIQPNIHCYLQTMQWITLQSVVCACVFTNFIYNMESVLYLHESVHVMLQSMC